MERAGGIKKKENTAKQSPVVEVHKTANKRRRTPRATPLGKTQAFKQNGNQRVKSTN